LAKDLSKKDQLRPSSPEAASEVPSVPGPSHADTKMPTEEYVVDSLLGSQRVFWNPKGTNSCFANSGKYTQIDLLDLNRPTMLFLIANSLLVNLQDVLQFIIKNRTKSSTAELFTKLNIDCGKSGEVLKKLLVHIDGDLGDGEQHDSQQYLSGFLNKIEEELPPEELAEWNQLVTITQTSRGFCIHCGTENHSETLSTPVLQVR